MFGMRKKIEKKLLDNYENYYRLAYTYVRNETDAMDIVQESAYKAIKGSSSLKKEEYLSTWLYRIVVNTALDYIRKNKKEIVGIIEEEKSCEDSYIDFDVMDSLNRLDKEDRIIVVLRFFEELRFEDIASITGENVNTVKSRLYRALKKLKIDMEEPNIMNQERWKNNEK